MGFGLLFIGYFVATCMPLMPIDQIGFIFWLIGYAIVLLAARRLLAYHKDFRYLFFATLLMLGISAACAVSDVTAFLYDHMILQTKLFSETADSILSIVRFLGELIFHFGLCFSIRSIAKETEVEKISVAAVRNFIFFAVYEVLNIVSTILLIFLGGIVPALMAFATLLCIVCLILNAIMIFSCYAWICDPSDVEMERKPSRFAFVNRMREEAEARRLKKDAEYAEKERVRQERKKERKKEKNKK